MYWHRPLWLTFALQILEFVLLNIFFVSLLNVNLESVVACWPVIACIVVNIGYVVLVTVLGFG